MKKNMIGYNWRSTKVTPGVNLDQCYINCNFYLAELKGVRITGEFVNCVFTSAQMSHVNIIGATFKNCKFIGTCFNNCSLRKITFENCIFNKASFKLTSGTTSCLFDNNCKGLEDIEGELTVEHKGSTGGFNVFPTKLSNLYSIKSTSLTEVTTTDITSDELVSPTMLPPTNNYRSPPSQVLKSSLLDDDDGDDDYYAYTYGCHGYMPLKQNKSKYGYMNNAVLECKNIEEFRRWKR